MNATEIKKDLYKSKNMATFSHYCKGKLYYNVELTGEDIKGVYQFPISTIQSEGTINIDTDNGIFEEEILALSEDLGDTAFAAEIKGSDLNRWIAKAVDKGEFIKIG